MFDYSYLRGKIVQMFKTQGAFAKAIGKDDSYISRFLNEKFYLNQTEMVTWAKVLDAEGEIDTLFFTMNVDKSE